VLVYQETVLRGRRVFLDFTRNPAGNRRFGEFALDGLHQEAHSYLQNSGALLTTPVERLQAMNEPALALYRSHGIDLTREPLEIAVCAQHNNGGLKGNIWWESNIRHLFPVGEVNGSHGVRRPGGAALNAGQVGGIRAATFITKRCAQLPASVGEFATHTATQVGVYCGLAQRMRDATGAGGLLPEQVTREIQDRMSAHAAIMRRLTDVKSAAEAAWALRARAHRELTAPGPAELPMAFRALDLALTHAVYLEGLREHLERGGKSRGSYLVLDEAGVLPGPGFDDRWRFVSAESNDLVNQKILEVHLEKGLQLCKRWVDIRPIPEDAGWFETVWRDYSHDRIVR
jgi:succinate dehydrogenase/fumarate reductase flavoprotein subunit